jgi:hypothetical protein
MGNDNMTPAYNFEPKYRVTLLTREDWTKGTGSPPVVKGLGWYTDGSRMQDGRTGAGAHGQSKGRRLSISLGKYVTFSRPRFMLLWPVSKKFKTEPDHRNT